MYEKECELAIKAVREAGSYLKSNEKPRVSSAIGKDIKLSSDVNSENILIGYFEKTGFSILSEERGVIEGAVQDYMWIIDPLDGTANYWKGMQELSCVSVALWKKNEPILGVVYRFQTDELYWGIVGEGAWKNNVKIGPSKISHLNEAVLATGFPVKRDYGRESLDFFISQIQIFKKIRMLGAAAIMGTFVAAGYVDVYMEDRIMIWDIAAASAIVKACGGEVKVIEKGNFTCDCKLFANQELLLEYEQTF